MSFYQLHVFCWLYPTILWSLGCIYVVINERTFAHVIVKQSFLAVGVVLDDNITWKSHISSLAVKYLNPLV